MFYKNLTMLCRICLTDVTPLIGIFSDDGMKHQLSDKIRICLQIQIQRDDYFPDKVCCKCFMSVNEFFSFWKKARDSYNLLQKLQKDVTLKKSVSWPSANMESEDVVIETTPDLLDMIDMETNTEKRQIADILKQTGDNDYMSNFTGKNSSTFPSLPADENCRENFPSSISRRDAPSRYLHQDAVYNKPTIQSIHDTKSWKYFSEECPVQQQPQTGNNEQYLDSKPTQFNSKHFSFGRPSMAYDFPKEVQEKTMNSWEVFHGEKTESKLHIAEKEKEHENLSNSFSFSMKCTNSKDTNSPFEHKPHTSGSQPIFSSNDEYGLPNIPLSLFSPSDDIKLSLLPKKNMKTEHAENLQPHSPIIGASKENDFSQKPNDIEMTPRSKVMKMLNREMW